MEDQRGRRNGTGSSENISAAAVVSPLPQYSCLCPHINVALLRWAGVPPLLKCGLSPHRPCQMLDNPYNQINIQLDGRSNGSCRVRSTHVSARFDLQGDSNSITQQWPKCQQSGLKPNVECRDRRHRPLSAEPWATQGRWRQNLCCLTSPSPVSLSVRLSQHA